MKYTLGVGGKRRDGEDLQVHFGPVQFDKPCIKKYTSLLGNWKWVLGSQDGG